MFTNMFTLPRPPNTACTLIWNFPVILGIGTTTPHIIPAQATLMLPAAAPPLITEPILPVFLPFITAPAAAANALIAALKMAPIAPQTAIAKLSNKIKYG